MANNDSGKKNYHRPNLWGMIRDIGVASLNKGQFPLALVGSIMIILLIKMPSADASKLVSQVLELFASMHLLGWAIAFFLCIGWLYHAKHLRKRYSSELNRIGEEKKKLQEELSKRRLSSSNKKR